MFNKKIEQKKLKEKEAKVEVGVKRKAETEYTISKQIVKYDDDDESKEENDEVQNLEKQGKNNSLEAFENKKQEGFVNDGGRIII